MTKLANKVSLIQDLKFPQLAQVVTHWRANNPGKPFVAFLAGDTAYDPPSYVTDALHKSLKHDRHKYSSPPGEEKVLKVLAEDYARMGIAALDPQKNICVTHGSLEALHLSALVLLNPGDEAIIPVPYYFFYPFHVRLSEGIPRFVKTEAANGFKLTANELKSAITDKTKILYLNTPLNPVGSVYSSQELKSMAEVLVPYENIFILCDEIYERFTLDQEHISLWAIAPKLRDRILIFNSFSKPFGYSGLRVGWVAGPEDILGEIKKIKGSSSYNTNTLGQAAVYAALSDKDKCEQEMETLRERLRSGRDLMVDRLNFMGIEISSPPAGMFLFPKVPESLIIPKLKIEGGEEMTTAERFAYWLIPSGTTVAPGIDMGPFVVDYFRIFFALDLKTIDQGLDSIEKALKQVS